ncbi:2-phosphosulfolactate phosphatase [Bacillus spongiae]|uniref:Probable 2-phosphosulfolactate phosphatase n=1 Tax=Bacillus spongiae TaxID=2683610 RepID=A0ABU8HCL1_9BACI
MTKVHLLTRKEEIDEFKLKKDHKVAVVLDILLATTTITSALYDGATEVIPVLNRWEAEEIFQRGRKEETILAGEEQAKPIKGFIYPSPLLIRPAIKGKRLILSTTNGTVALRKAAVAKKVYIASLLNNQAVSEAIHADKKADCIIVICAGNSGEFCLEDFYGAGDFIHCLTKNHKQDYTLTDAAKAALYFYQSSSKIYDILSSSHVGQLMKRFDAIEEVIFASKKGSIPIVPILKGQKVIIEHSIQRKE